MNFWTAFASRHSYSWRDRERFPFKLEGSLEADGKDPTEVNDPTDSRGIVLVGATREDLQALGNAALYCLNEVDGTYVALAPKHIDSGDWLKTRKTETDAWRNNWHQHYKESASLVVDGQLEPVCTGCKNIIRRASGACLPGLISCDKQFFSPAAKMAAPPMDMYLPTAKCCDRKPFQPVRLADLDFSVTLTNTIGKTMHRHSVKAAIRTKRLKRLVCTACLFGYEHGCAGGRHPGYCAPVFATDIPEPSPESRASLRLLNRRIGTDQYIEAAKEHNWEYKNWRVDPNLYVGISGAKGGLTLAIRKERGAGRRGRGLAYPLTEPGHWPKVQEVFGLEREPVTEPPTLLEKLILHLLSIGCLDRGPNQGWGYSSYLSTIEYDEKRDEANLIYCCSTYSFSQRIKDVQSVASYHPGIPYYFDSKENRQKALEEILTAEKPGETIRFRQCREIIGDLKWHSDQGKPVPEIDEELTRVCLERVWAHKEQWKPKKQVV